MMSKNKYSRILVMLAAVISGGAWGATPVCSQYMGRPTRVNETPTITSQAISIGADVPVGTVLLTINANNTAQANSLPSITCAPASDGSTYNINQYLRLFGVARPVAGWTGQYAGALYQTDVSGIGFAIVNRDGTTAGQAIQNATPVLKWTTPISPPGFSFYYGNRISVVFIKTGPISPGVISGASLTRVVLSASSSITTTGLETTPWITQFTGSIPVTVSTCNVASSPTVSLGKHNIETYFGSGRQNSTPWVPFSVLLSGCTQFLGTNATGTVELLTTSSATYSNWQTNYLQTTFVPVYGVIDDAQAIMRLQPVTGSATGVGIQIAQDTGAVDPVAFSFSTGLRQDIRTNVPGSIAIPMKARYIRNGTDPVRPGLANSRTVFTVNYR
ncbi:hypothetical protein CIG19_02430 [Enterobacterales bacterium CwR94]|nr:hypothetical protein CIG19_02430 [Enterobacterales bacterium CwR94]